MQYIDLIIRSPDSVIAIRDSKAYGEILDIRLPNGMGARWTLNGETFIGFLERYTTK